MAIRTLLTMSLLVAGSTLAAQQTPGWKVGAAFPYALDELHTVTNQRLMGLCLDGAYQGAFDGSQAFWRLGVGLNVFPGKAQEGPKTDLTGFQVTFDALKPLGQGRTALLFGLSLNTWTQKTSGLDRWGKSNELSGTVSHAFGKVGVRLGLEHSLTPRLALTTLLQVAELGTDNAFLQNGSPTRGRSGVNPSWIQVGLRASF